MIGTNDQHNPFHRSSDPLSIDLLNFELLRTLHVVDSILQCNESLFLHFLVPKNRVSYIGPVLLVVLLVYLLQILSKVIKIHVLNHGVHLL